MRFLKRLFGFPDRLNAGQLADDIFSGKSEKSRQKAEKQADMDIANAMSDQDVKATMDETGLREMHLRNLYRRIYMDCDRTTAVSAITTPNLVRWFAENGGTQMHLSFEQAIQLVNFAKTGSIQ